MVMSERSSDNGLLVVAAVLRHKQRRGRPCTALMTPVEQSTVVHIRICGYEQSPSCVMHLASGVFRIQQGCFV